MKYPLQLMETFVFLLAIWIIQFLLTMNLLLLTFPSFLFLFMCPVCFALQEFEFFPVIRIERTNFVHHLDFMSRKGFNFVMIKKLEPFIHTVLLIDYPA